jgi:type I restriction enzyme S subunit
MALTVSLDDIVASGNSLLAIKPHWQRVRLGDVGQVLNGYAFKAELFTREGGMPLIRIRDVGSAASETFYSGDYDDRYVVRAGDLLVGMDGDFNCARWRGPRSLLNQRVCKITVDEALYSPGFLDYVLPGYLKAINDATSSITVKHLSSRTIQDIPLPLPPMDEQREIVAELEKQFSRLDEAVANLQRVKTNLKHYKDSVYSEAFRNAPNSTLGELIEVGPQNGLYLPKDMYGDGVPILRIDDYQTAWIRPVQELRRVKATQEQIPTWALCEDDLVVNRVNSMTHLGKCVRIPKSLAGTVFESNMMRMRLTAASSPKYVEHYLASRLGKKRLTGNAKWAVNQASINQKDVRATPIFVPDLAAQLALVTEIDRQLSIVRVVEVEVDTNLKRAQTLRQATLAKAYGVGSGQI